MLGKYISLLILVFASLTATLSGTVNGQDFIYHETFDDADVTSDSDGGVWNFEQFGSSGNTMDASSGDLVFNSHRFVDAYLTSFDSVPVEERTEWSFRARVTVQSGTFAAVGTRVFNHAALTPDGLRVGTNEDNSTKPLPYSYYGEEFLIQMDAFDSVLTGFVWKEGDPTSLVQHSYPYVPTPTLPNFGVNGDVIFHEAWVSTTPLSVPEPSTLPLAGLALISFCVFRQRRSI